MKKILIITDAWDPQVNGVVVTLIKTIDYLRSYGYEVKIIEPSQFKTIPCPTYPEIRLPILSKSKIKKIFSSFDPDYMHIATEGPLGLAARNFAKKSNFNFTTSYHTKFPEYISARFPIPLDFGYYLLRWFHKYSSAVMVSNKTLEKELHARKFKNLKLWNRGVDTSYFYPRPTNVMTDLKKPIHLYVGRVSIEKNLEDFLSLGLIGSKVVIGDGPDLKKLKNKFPNVYFLGYKFGEELAEYYAASDIFVFPSKSDTFGLVILEALASGLPVAAYPVTGPKDILTSEKVGFLSGDLKQSIEYAYKLKKDDAVEFAKDFTWENCSKKFAKNLVPIYFNKIEGEIPYGSSDILSKRFLRGVGLINDKF